MSQGWDDNVPDMTPEEEEQQIAAFSKLQFARRTLEADEIERLILNAEQLEIPVNIYLEHHARTPALITLLREHPDPLVRVVVCRVFHDTRPRSARQPLLEALFDPDPWVRLEAADAYLKVARREDAPIVLAALELEGRIGIKSFLIAALGNVRADRAAPALVDLLDNPKLVDDAKWALGRLSPEAVRAAIATTANPEEAGRLRRELERLSSAPDASG